MRRVFQISFLQLTFLFLIALVLTQNDIISDYILQLELFALVIALMGISLFYDQRGKKISIKPNYVYLLLIFLFLLSVGFRVLPYLDSSIPLGFDSGIYKNIFSIYQSSLPSIPETGLATWIKDIHDPALFVLMDVFFIFGTNLDEVLKFVFILLSSFLIFPIFILTKKYSNDVTALLASFFFVFSFLQFSSFNFMLYKNVVALSVFLVGLYLFDKRENFWSLVLISVFLGFLHRPTFLLYLLILVVDTVVNYAERGYFMKNLKLIFISGISLIFLYYHRINEAFLDSILSRVISGSLSSGAGGAFFTLPQYQFYSLIYLPFAILGVFYFIYNRKFKNPIFIWFVINSIIVVFRLIFFNRYILHLDIVMLIMAGFGLYSVFDMKNYRKIAVFVVVFSILIAGWVGFDMIKDVKPLISQKELDSIIWLSNNTEEDAFVMATFNKYGPWMLGYSQRETIAPGMFEYDFWTTEQWIEWWENDDLVEFKESLDEYGKPLYVHVGGVNRFVNKTHFEDNCFKEVFNDNRSRIYKYLC